MVGQLTSYTDATTAATPLNLMKQIAGGNLEALKDLPSSFDLLIGNNGGCLGEVSALALLLGLAYMLWKKIITRIFLFLYWLQYLCSRVLCIW